jgi:hypothetical protein
MTENELVSKLANLRWELSVLEEGLIGDQRPSNQKVVLAPADDQQQSSQNPTKRTTWKYGKETDKKPSVRVGEITFFIETNNCMSHEHCSLCPSNERADAPYTIKAFPGEPDGESCGWICSECAEKHVPLLFEAKQALNRVHWDEVEFVKVKKKQHGLISNEINSLAELFRVQKQMTPESLVQIAALCVEQLQAAWREREGAGDEATEADRELTERVRDMQYSCQIVLNTKTGNLEVHHEDEETPF